MMIDIPRRPLTVDDYARMREAGIFGEDERLELLNGEVRALSPAGSVHAAIVKRLNVLLNRSVGDTAIVSVQNPIRLDDWDVAHDRVEQYTQPRGSNYRMKLLVERGEAGVAQRMVGVQIEVEQVFG